MKLSRGDSKGLEVSLGRLGSLLIGQWEGGASGPDAVRGKFVGQFFSLKISFFMLVRR